MISNKTDLQFTLNYKTSHRVNIFHNAPKQLYSEPSAFRVHERDYCDANVMFSVRQWADMIHEAEQVVIEIQFG